MITTRRSFFGQFAAMLAAPFVARHLKETEPMWEVDSYYLRITGGGAAKRIYAYEADTGKEVPVAEEFNKRHEETGRRILDRYLQWKIDSDGSVTGRRGTIYASY